MRTLFFFLLLAISTLAISQENYWTEATFQRSPADMIQAARLINIDTNVLAALLEAESVDGSISIQVPLPNGRNQRFLIQPATTMAPELAKRFPEISVWQGQGIDNPSATISLDLTPRGFHVMILSTDGSVFIDPRIPGSGEHLSYFKHDYQQDASQVFECGVNTQSAAPGINGVVIGTELRTYRLALAATGEYTQFHGGTVGSAMAEMVTAMNRVNGVYQRDLGITMQLVANNDQVIYTNGGTDPYTNNSGGAMLDENQTNLDTVIGTGSYDIGHVFSTGGGGVAGLGVSCSPSQKAWGVTGLSNPSGDPFYVDYVAHEMGHQWGGNHTFNGNAGSCVGGNRNGSTAFEPGSGSTIQAYAGICSPQNLQFNSDAYFHTASFDEIVGFSTLAGGNSCAAITVTGNTPPTVNAGADYTIPANTPFILCGSGNDVDADALTFAWEEFDLGPAGAPNSPVGDAPIFRSFSPVASPCRTFPKNSDLLAGTQTIGELLPTYSRVLNFRLTVRDNNVAAGGVAYDQNAITVDDTTGPFRLTVPAGAGVFWQAGETQAISWNVAGTDSGAVACANVDILFSTNGGNSFALLLATTANDGSENITVPAISSNQVRVAVACSDNVFFNVNSANITISAENVFADGFEAVIRRDLLGR